MTVNARDEQVFREGLIQGSPNVRDAQVWREGLIQGSPNVCDQQIWRESLIPQTNVITPTLPVFPTSPLMLSFPFHESPRFNTLTRTPQSNRGQVRIATFTQTPWAFSWDLNYIPGDAQQTNSAWQTLLSFYMSAMSSYMYFLFYHPYRHTANNVAIATGDGTTTQFSMGITYVPGGALELVQQFATVPQIYINGVLQSIFQYNISKYGTVTFLAAPPASSTISWTGTFYYMCSFVGDSWTDLSEDFYQLWSKPDLKIESAYF
jgi:hypothetical protein